MPSRSVHPDALVSDCDLAVVPIAVDGQSRFEGDPHPRMRRARRTALRHLHAVHADEEVSRHALTLLA
jgi:hypothetical protein